MAIVTKIIRIDNKEVARVGVNKFTRECAVLEQVASAVQNSGATVKDKTEIAIYDGEADKKPRTLQWNTLEKYLRDCEDVVY